MLICLSNLFQDISGFQIVYFKPLLVGVGWKLVKGLLKARNALKLEIEDDYHSQISVLRMLVEAQMLVRGHQAVARKFGEEFSLTHPPLPMEEFRLVLAGLQGKVYLIEVKNTLQSRSGYLLQGYLNRNHG